MTPRGAGLDGELADTLCECATKRGYDGVTLAAYKAEKEAPEIYGSFVSDLREKLKSRGKILFLENDGNGSAKIKESADGYVITYEKSCLDNPKAIDEQDGALMREYHGMGISQRAFIELPSFAYSDGEPLGKKEAERLAYNAGVDIKNNENGTNSFEYNRYKRGKKEVVKVVYESLKNIKAKLDLVGELGFMGVSFDIASVPTEYLMLLEVLFRKPRTTPYFDM